jgi:hypothetical protein
MRRTPPVAQQVIDTFQHSNALLQKRLIDFDTGSPNLEAQHKAWLMEAMNRAKTNAAFHTRIYGFASRLGQDGANRALSMGRMNSVFTFVKNIDGRALNTLEMWEAYGSSVSGGKATDDSPEWRAVEVHIFIGEIPPPPEPPHHRKVTPPNKPPLPGGPRYGRWAVAAPGGATFTIGPSIGPLTAGVTVGANFVFVRNEDTKEVRKYAALAGGLGASLGLPANFKSLKNALQTILTGPNFSGVSFEPVFAADPVTWEEVEKSFVKVQGVNAGAVVISGSAAVITFTCPEMWKYGQSGVPLKVTEEIWSFNSSGRNYQLGVGGSHVEGPMIRL